MSFFATLDENLFFFVTSTIVNFQLIFQLSIKSVSMHGRIAVITVEPTFQQVLLSVSAKSRHSGQRKIFQQGIVCPF